MKKIKKFLKKNPGLVMIFFLFIAVFLILSPVFEFPLNDSWAHAKSVKNFADNQEIRMSEWTAASFLFQMFYGYLFTLPFGFSFTALRISTITLSFFGIVAFYFILKEFKFSETISTLGVLLLFFNPLYFNLSYTFMTDIPFISLILLSTLFYIRWFKNKDTLNLSLGILFSIFAILVRQNAILLPIAVLIYVFLNRERTKFTFKKITTIGLIPFAVLVLYQLWYIFIHGASVKYAVVSTTFISFFNPIKIIGFLLLSIYFIGAYFFLFVPLFVKNIKRLKNLLKEKFFLLINIVIFFILGMGFLIYYIFMKNFPFLGYQGFLLNNYGLGPKLLAGIPQTIPNFVWLIISIFAIFASLIFVSIIIYEIIYKKNFTMKSLKRLKLKKESLSVFIIIVLFLQLLFVLTKGTIFDRYILVIVPFSIILLFSFMKEFRFRFQLRYIYLIIITMAIFSIMGTQDYINYNKAGWYATTTLLKDGVSEKQIDGGFEFNGWYNYEYALENLDVTREKEKNKILEMFKIKGYSQEHLTKEGAISWWFIVDDEYIVSFSEIENYKTIKKLEYKSYLFPGKQYVYVLKRS